ncbi:MAG: hypothetical protein R3279_09235 [Putridiphycobacter sp.]|nr:hypothetical protein [Putridiphycobacter sp.]
MKQKILIFIIAIIGTIGILSVTKRVFKSTNPTGITCNINGCEGTYSGPEFTNGSDVAHQFSNQMADRVGKQLKKLYSQGIYVKVALKQIIMNTKGMDHTGDVVYHLSIPFITVSDSCQAATAFDHRGGWGHEITKAQALNPFKNKKGLSFIELKTPEGLQEFWMQWRHEHWQQFCE